MQQTVRNQINRLKDRREQLKSQQAVERKIRYLQRELVRLSFSNEDRAALYPSLIRSLKEARGQRLASC